jgi:cephalosporin hydroxylase
MPTLKQRFYPLLSRCIRCLRGPIARAFHILYYDSDTTTWKNTNWLGVTIRKNPMDLWIYQEIIFQQQPDVLIECGTFQGGSALYFASLFDLIGNGRVISLDIEDFPDKPPHARIEYLTLSSVSGEAAGIVKARIRPGERVMVCLDSNHAREHVLTELRIYGPMVTKGQYLVVEDTNINGHPVSPEFGPGPMEAVEAFLEENPEFVPRRDWEKFLLTFHPGGFLCRRD